MTFLNKNSVFLEDKSFDSVNLRADSSLAKQIADKEMELILEN